MPGYANSSPLTETINKNYCQKLSSKNNTYSPSYRNFMLFRALHYYCHKLYKLTKINKKERTYYQTAKTRSLLDIALLP